MQDKQETSNALERNIDLAVAVADLEKDAAVRLARRGRTARMDGFRPGKVPQKILEQRFGGEARSDARRGGEE